MTKAEIVLDVYKKYTKAYEVISQPSPFLQDAEGNSISPKQYWNNCRRRFNAIADLPSYREGNKWMSRYNKALSRNKTMGIVAYLASQYIGTSVIAQNKSQKEDRAVGMLLKDLAEWSFEQERFEASRFWGLLTASIEGRVIWEEEWVEPKQTVKDITEIRDDGTYAWTKKEIECEGYAKTNIVPNDQFLVPNPLTRNLEEQDYVIRVYRMTMNQARKVFGHYKGFKNVRPGKHWMEESDEFKQFASYHHLAENEVMIIKCYDLQKDQMDVVAGGALLTEKNNPIPRPTKAKRYPFVIQIFEPIDNDYFTGKGIIDRTAREEDGINVLYRLLNDREFLNVVPPTETDNDALFGGNDVLAPGMMIERLPGKEGTKPILPAVSTAALTNIIQMLEKNADDASISQLMQGQQVSGGTPTATQTLQMVKSAQTLLNTFNELQRHAIAELSELRLQTLLWNLEADQIKKISVHDRILKNGKRGSRTFLFEDLQNLTDEEAGQMSMNILEYERSKKGKEEIIVVDKNELLENMKYYVKVDAEPKPRRTDDLMKLLSMDKFNFYKANAEFFNPLVAAEDVAYSFGDDPDEVVQEQAGQVQAQGKIMSPDKMPSIDAEDAMGIPK